MNHDAFVFAAYGLSLIGIAGLALWIFADRRARQRELAQLESAGIRRRSAEAPK